MIHDINKPIVDSHDVSDFVWWDMFGWTAILAPSLLNTWQIRQGGPGMKDSAAYPRKFAKKIYKEHTASMEDPWYLDYDGLCLSSLPCQPIPELWIKLESS